MRCIILFLALVGLAQASPVQLPVQPRKEWTFLIFLNGNNNLNRFGRDNLIDMEKVGSTDQLNIVVQWADIEYKKTQQGFKKLEQQNVDFGGGFPIKIRSDRTVTS